MIVNLSTTSDASIRHQKLLAQIIRPATLSLFETVKVKEGSSALCLNCGEGDIVFHLSGMVGDTGTVMGIDTSEENINTAKQLTRIKNIRNAHFCTTEQYGQGNGQQFELIHVRLSLPRLFDPLILIEEIRSHLMPGGLALFEVVDFSGFNCTPKNIAFERFLDLHATLVRSHWGDAPFSNKLKQLIAQSDFQHLQHQYVSPAFLQGTAKRLLSLTLESIQADVLSQKLTSEDELQVLLYELKDFEQQAFSLISLPGIHQIWGQRA